MGILLNLHFILLPLDADAQQAEINSEQRPNIILILTDDQRWDALGFAGNPIIQTPNMDQLAAEGFYFKNAFVTTPICAASRASILTGMYERTHEFTFRTPPLADEFVQMSYPAQLKKAGYKTGYIGKFGVRTDSIDFFAPESERDENEELFDFFERYGEGFWARTFIRLIADPVDGEYRDFAHITNIIGQRSRDFINKYKDEPFCLTMSFHAPHAEDVDPRQYIWPDEVDHLYRDVEIPKAEMSDPEWFGAQPKWVREGLNRIRWHWRFTPDKYQDMVKGYYRMTSGVDKEIGRLRKHLRELNIDQNTIILLIGDNGYFLGERGFAGKWLMYEPSLRVPLIVYDPRNRPEKNVRREMALNIDISPTILDYAGIDPPTQVQGKSLRRLIENEDEIWRDHFICEHLMHGKTTIPKSEGIRTEQYKYFRYIEHMEHEELYNLKVDPQEKNNLINTEKYQSILIELRDKLNHDLQNLAKMRIKEN
jgi:arylsulfatase A-like enzyme